MKLLISFLYIGVSLQTYYFYQLGAPLFSLISLTLLFLIIINDLKITLNNSTYTFVFYLLITFFSFLSAFYFEEKILPSKLIGFFIVFISAFIANILYNSKNIPSLIKIYLTFHVSFFYIQFISFYLFKIHIDFLLPITGEEQRVFGGSFEIPYLNSFMRACGLFNEPGTYVTFVAPFIVLFGRWSKSFNRYAKFLYILNFSKVLPGTPTKFNLYSANS